MTETTKEKAQAWIQRFCREVLQPEEEQAFNGTCSPVCELLSLCMCGDPERLILLANNTLEFIAKRADAASWNQGDTFETYTEKLRWLLECPNDAGGASQAPWVSALVYNWLDSAGLLEHGSHLPGWLTPKGEAFLKVMKDWPGDIDDIWEVVKPCIKPTS